ncbi:17e5f134-1afb-4707-ba2f-992fd7785928 [Thermothielavioides terrestris]|uniref:Uncharacterized protein n=2 Tax=Thermothielavioides terrestris TaxID=2587410 RepID=G2RI74_THETT|nr:uncharacterized protein THITE_2124047 [Thermothielavioides terrestris NRRL 8126]AEO71536.1 hypothetical protein THITE_2124047 [Thermothielavioides terrestris NRRL 8126]SPQ27479.1 17e5f134-1afb-4707-ba2f-992fd7785928 [Thermothielavioides terrestris]
MEANDAGRDPAAAPAQKTGDPHAAFKQFDTYPWTLDRSFLQGLMASLGPLLGNKTDGFARQKALSTTLQARIWWYKSRFNRDIDRLSYEAYCLANPSLCPDGAILTRLEEIQQRMASYSSGDGSARSSSVPSQDEVSIPAWQRNAPKVDLSKKADDGTIHRNTGDTAPYPEDFQNLVDAVLTGKPIPGIKEIPDKVVRPPGITPFGKMKAPPKPWEKNRPLNPDAYVSIFGDVLDKEFPPLEDDKAVADNKPEADDKPSADD